jgi:error-prone DNA polymerase
MHDASHELHRLSEDLLPTTLKIAGARADHCTNPLPSKFGPRENLRTGADDPFRPIEYDQWTPPGPGNRECGFHGGHPRDARVIPKSRDFH